MSGLDGREWAVWEQVDDVVNVALSAATSAYLSLIDYPDDPTMAKWRQLSANLAELKQELAKRIGTPVPENLHQTPIYTALNDNLSDASGLPGVQAAIESLPQGFGMGIDLPHVTPLFLGLGFAAVAAGIYAFWRRR
ncbi:MAG: hypothetical protein V4563_10670 [Pseudomonadota bacterium]